MSGQQLTAKMWRILAHACNKGGVQCFSFCDNLGNCLLSFSDVVILGCDDPRVCPSCLCWFYSGNMKTGQSGHAFVSVVSNGVSGPQSLIPLFRHWSL